MSSLYAPHIDRFKKILEYCKKKFLKHICAIGALFNRKINMKNNASIQNINTIDPKTFSQKISLSKRQIFRLNSFGKIPAPLKIGGAIRWNDAEVSAWIIAGCPDRKHWMAIKGANDGAA